MNGSRLRPSPPNWLYYASANFGVLVFWTFLIWPRVNGFTRLVAAPASLAITNLVFWCVLKLRDSRPGGSDPGSTLLPTERRQKLRRRLILGVSLVCVGVLELAFAGVDFLSRNVISSDSIFGMILILLGVFVLVRRRDSKLDIR